MSRHEILGPGNQAGIVIGAGSVPTTFTRSLSERSWIDQGIITGLTVGTHYMLTVVAQDLIDAGGTALSTALPLPDSWSDETRRRFATWLLDAAAIPAGFGAAAAIGFSDEDDPLMPSIARQIAWRFGITGLAGTALGATQLGQTWLDNAVGANGKIARIPASVPVGLALAAYIEKVRQNETPPEHGTDPAGLNSLAGLGAGLGIVGVLAGLAAGEQWVARELGSVGSRVLPGSEATWRRFVHLVALGGLGYGTAKLWGRAMRQIEAGTTTYEDGMDDAIAGVWTNPMVSGDPASLVSWESLGREGRRHAVTYVRAEPPPADLKVLLPGAEEHPRPELSIPTVMGKPAKAWPIQVFVGLDASPDPAERVELALAEMDRTDAWSRSLIMLVSPTGTGYVNYVAIAAAQYMTLGDMASVTLQYSKRPSPLSLGKVHDAQIQNRLLWLRILQRLRDVPKDKRPKVVIFGESLGAHTSQAVLEGWGTMGAEALGIDNGLWIGTPAASGWRHELMDKSRIDVDHDIVAVVNDYEQFLALGEEEKERKRFVLLSHDNDGVTKFEANLITRRPSWLGPNRPKVEEIPNRSPRGIPSSMRWRPVTTFFQTLIDMKNAQIPGSYRAWAHDYREDLPEFIRDVYNLDCSDEDLEKIKVACRQREEFREAIFK